MIGRGIVAPKGQVLGGASAIDVMVHIRRLPSDFEGWVATGCASRSHEDVRPFFVRSELSALLGPSCRGALGEFPVHGLHAPDPVPRHLLRSTDGFRLGRTDRFASMRRGGFWAPPGAHEGRPAGGRVPGPPPAGAISRRSRDLGAGFGASSSRRAASTRDVEPSFWPVERHGDGVRHLTGGRPQLPARGVADAGVGPSRPPAAPSQHADLDVVRSGWPAMPVPGRAGTGHAVPFPSVPALDGPEGDPHRPPHLRLPRPRCRAARPCLATRRRGTKVGERHRPSRRDPPNGFRRGRALRPAIAVARKLWAALGKSPGHAARRRLEHRRGHRGDRRAGGPSQCWRRPAMSAQGAKRWT